MSPCYEGTYAMAKGSPERIISYLLAYFTWSPGDITQKGVRRKIVDSKQYLPYARSECRVLLVFEEATGYEANRTYSL